MLISFAVLMPLERFLAVRGRVEQDRPSRCPACGDGRLTFAGWWTRLTRQGPVDIHRVACAGCGATHSLWPNVLVAGCGDTAATVGAVLELAATGAGHRPIAARIGLAATTVRGWLRRFRRHAAAATTRLRAWSAAVDPTLPDVPIGTPILAAVGAVFAAAVAFFELSGEALEPWPLAVRVLGGRLLS
jgi:transposase-like protein